MKKKIPFPIYSVSEFEGPATCEDGPDCDPAENPSHHVRIDLTDEARAIVEHLIFCMVEAHESATSDNYGDGTLLDRDMRAHRREEPECSYCRAIKDARALLKYAKEA